MSKRSGVTWDVRELTVLELDLLFKIVQEHIPDSSDEVKVLQSLYRKVIVTHKLLEMVRGK